MRRFQNALLLAVLLAPFRTGEAHNGPPFPIIENKQVGPCIIALWTHPDIGLGTFFVILDPLPGHRMPKNLDVQIGIQPVSGRLPEVMYKLDRDDQGQVQYKTDRVNFDRDEMWRARLVLHTSDGDGEAVATVEATPTGLGKWDLLWFGAPFLGAGFLWFRAARRKFRPARP